MPKPSNLAFVEAATVCLLNVQRRARGLAPFRSNRALQRAAFGHSWDMVAHGYFAHNSLSGATLDQRVRSTGYLRHARGFAIGENIAAATSYLATPANTVRSWMHSPEHRANILSRAFHDTGVGIVPAWPGVRGRHHRGGTYTQDLGTRG